jgi:hypothetical protein
MPRSSVMPLATDAALMNCEREFLGRIQIFISFLLTAHASAGIRAINYRWLLLYWGLRFCESPLITNSLKTENVAIPILNIKLTPEYLVRKITICITFPEKPGEVVARVIGFIIWPRIRHWCPLAGVILQIAKSRTRVACVYMSRLAQR